jgi:chromate transporter
MTMAPPEPRPPHLTLPALFARFLGFGLLAFGGPVAQIAMVRQRLVDEEGWMSPARFNRLLAVMQALPGPEAHELCVHMGMMARGRVGGLLAGLGFMVPGFVLMLAAAWAYVRFVSGNLGFSGPLLGVQIVVLAVILRAVVRIGQHALKGRLLVLLGLAALLASALGVPFWIPLVAAGLVAAAAHKPALAAGLALAAAGLAVALNGASLPPSVPITQRLDAPSLTALFVAGLKGGLLTFGGAYTAIPYVRADTVGRGWLSEASFLDGIAVAGILPAPLVIFATFVGYVAGGFPGAFAITAGMFLPAFGFSLLFFERLEALVETPSLHRLLAGVAAAAVGIIGHSFLEIASATLARIQMVPAAAAVFAVALGLVWRVKSPWVTPLTLGLGAVAGALLSL